MHIHILGICGTFMGSLALIARSLGHTVTGSDAGIYPPMSTQLEAAGVQIQEGRSSQNCKGVHGSGAAGARAQHRGPEGRAP